MFAKRNSTNLIVVHCSATSEKADVGVEDIRRWHRAKGWLDIGYHFVIRRSGEIEAGRPVDTVGAHVEGRNAHSVGVCLVGGVNIDNAPVANFTPAQYEALKYLLRDLKVRYPKATIHGHNEYAKKACPSFDVQQWLLTHGLN